MTDPTGTPLAQPSPDADTFPMVFGDGSRSMVPSARVNDAFKAGGKLAQPMRMSDGSTQLVPFDQVHDQMSKGATFMPSGAASSIPKPQAAMREVDPTAGTGVPGALLRAGQSIVGAPKATYHAFADAPQNAEEAGVLAGASSTQPGTGRLALAAKRLIYDPQRETYQQGQQMEDLANQKYGKPQPLPVGITTPFGTLPSSLATSLFGSSGQPVTPIAGGRHEAALRDTAGAMKMASMVPLVGPLAAHLAIAYKGDPSDETANEQNPYGTQGDPAGALTEGLAYAAEPALTEKLGALQGTGRVSFADEAGLPLSPGEEHVVSTRNPTGKPENNAFDPHADRSQSIGMKEILDAGIEDKVMKAIQEYPGMKGLLKGVTDPKEAMRRFINFNADNLVALHKMIPENIRELSKLWYSSANDLANELADTHAEHGMTPQQAAGVIAVNSPQTDWNMNVSRARRIMDIWLNQQDAPYSPEMAAKSGELKTASIQGNLARIKGKGLSEIERPDDQAMWIRLYDEAHNPTSYEIWRPDGTTLDVARNQPTPAQERAGQLGDPSKLAWASLDHIAKSIEIMKDGSLENISDQLGDKHKVRNFYNNIINPDGQHGHVTVDTHAVAAGLWRPLAGEDIEPSHNFGSGKRAVKDDAGNIIEPSIPSAGGNKNEGVYGTYGLYADAYRKAAEKLGVLPRELQSMTWEGIRSLFPDTFKTEANKAIIDNIWRQVDSGELTPKQARNQVIDAVAQIKNTDRAGVFTRPDWLSDTGRNDTGRSPANAPNVPRESVYGPSAESSVRGAGSRNPRGSSGQIAAPSPVPAPLKRVIRK